MATGTLPPTVARALQGEIRRGFLAMIPLWAGVVPFALAFAILARTAGFNVLETQALSGLVFAGAAQVAIVILFADGAGAGAIVATTLVLNLRHVLYGLSLSRGWGERTGPPHPLLAFLLTDESYGLTVKDGLDGGGGPGYFCGAGLSLYTAYNLATLAGALAGRFLPDSRHLGLDFIFPLTFVALLVPLLRNWRRCAVAALAAIAALLLSRVAAGGVAILLASVAAAGLGVALDHLGPAGSGRASWRRSA